MVEPRQVGLLAMRLADRSQDFPPEPQAVAAAYYFLLLCERYKLQPQDVFTITKNLLASSEAQFSHELRAVKDYVEHEL